MVLAGFTNALHYFSDPMVILWVLAGVIVGLIAGVLPGLQGMNMLAIFLPFTFVMQPQHALSFMVAVTATSFTGGVITAVLLGIPGDGPNIAACLDGFPMTKRGEAGRALGIALISSGLGGIVSGILALFMIPVILVMIFAITSADMVFIILIGLLCIGVLSEGSPRRGLISGGTGLLLSFIGLQATTGRPRFTFGAIYLLDGIPMLPMVLGLFAMPVMVELFMQGNSIADAKAKNYRLRDVLLGGKDVFANAWVFIRSTIVGYIVGIIPGIGAMTATWVSYGQAKATAKNGKEYGTGAIGGLIAASSATNASLGGDLLTTLALGIPGSSTMAILLGAMMMTRLVPGPAMLTDPQRLGLSLSLMYIVVIANLIGAAICIFFIPQMVKVATLPARIIIAITIPIIFVGTYVGDERFGDLIVLVMATILGVAMDKFSYSRPALFVGYILGQLFEKYFYIAYGTRGPLFFWRPISMVLITIILALLIYKPVKKLILARRRTERL
jgi:putative tricarboxylic transport membrane protein